MPATNVGARWANGSIEFYDVATGTTVASIGASGIGSMTRTGQRKTVNTSAKVGATAGWVLGGGAVNTGLMATVPASQTAATLVVPITGLKVGDVITAFSVHGQIDSAGNAVTLDADLRVMTPAVAGSTDASVGAITQISKTADYLVNDSKAGLSKTVAAGEGYYILLTATTGVTTDIELTSIAVTVTES